MALIRELAQSQGAYGRLLAYLECLSEEDREDTMDKLEAMRFADPVAFVMFMECGC